MEIKIKKVTKLPEVKQIIYIYNKIKDLGSGLLSKAEKNWLEQQHKLSPTELVSINQYDFQLMFIKSEAITDLNQQLEAVRKKGNELFGWAKKLKSKEIGIVNLAWDNDFVAAFIEGFALSAYKFDKYLPQEKDEVKVLSIAVWSEQTKSKQLKDLQNTIKYVFMARDLVNEPQNVLNATNLAAHFKNNAKQLGIKVDVWNKSKIEAMKMGGLLAVNKGSVQPPSFTIMEYKPKNAINEQPIVLVGKGVVYDTGGLSLKPTPGSMDSMKCDMAGAATVGCAVLLAAENELPLYIVALIPATDNRPSLEAYAPGDVITMMSGKTVEVLNTDAEGRLILADALHYAKKYNPKLVFDFATLTGAAVVAIGAMASVIMGTADNATFEALDQAAGYTHERLARFPFWDDYKELLKSDIADMKNIGGRYAGAITAGKFLEYYTDYPWVHFDIAGTAWLDAPESYRGKNGTGVGVRLLNQFFQQYIK